MKIIVSKEELNKGVNIVNKAVPVHTTMPILQCILIDATTDEIRLTANDMEIAIETLVQGTIEERGKIAIEARTFSDLVKKLPDNDVYIECDEKLNTTIKCEKATFNIVSKYADDFPHIPAVARNKPVELSQFTLKEIIRQTIFSIAENENNKLMTGELFEIKENRLKVVSLDGHRISIRNTELNENYDDVKVIVPGKTLNKINGIVPGDADKKVFIYFTENNIIFEFENTTVVSRLIDGEYFRIEQMLSSDYTTKIRVNKKQLMESLDRSTLLVREKDKKPIVFDITESNLNIRMDSSFGSMSEDIDLEKEGKDMRIGFNPKFYIDALRVIDEETVTIYYINPKAPCFIKDENETYIYLVLPVNIL